MTADHRRAFVDTNILVYSRNPAETEKYPIARSLIENLWQSRRGRLSTQVCSEYLVTVTRKLARPLDESEAWDDVESLLAWDPVPLDRECLAIARHVQIRYQSSWWDSLIVAAASIAGCEIIYTEDLNHGQEYLGIRAVDPFAS